MKDGQKGFIRTILLVILGLAALKYFLNWDIFDAAASDQGQSTIGYIRDIVNTVWAYVGAPVTFAWDNVVYPLLSLAWESLQTFIEWGRTNASTGI